MSAEGTPRTEPSLLAEPLRTMTRWVVRRPIAVLAAAVALTVGSLALAIGGLGFRTSRLDLLNPESQYNQLWIDYVDQFGHADEVVVVVEGDSRQKVLPALDDLSETLRSSDGLFEGVLHEVDLSRLRAKGLHCLSLENLQAIERFVDRVEPIVRNDWARLSVDNMAEDMRRRLADATIAAAPRAETEAELERLSASLLGAVGPGEVYQAPWPEMSPTVAVFSDLRSQHLLTNQGRMGFVQLRLAQSDNQNDNQSFAQGTEAIDALRARIARAQARHPEVSIGLTGLPVMENDEMRSSQSAMVVAGVLSLVGVACLFAAGFGGVRHPLLTVIALLLAMVWSFGYVTLAIGHLNILSIAFAVILIGLGIDFGIHYVARYLLARRTTDSPGKALELTAWSVGPGIVTGALTTAISFFMAGFTEFTGIAELGIIAGGGILLCCAAALVVLPAMVYLADERWPPRVLPAPLDVFDWLGPLFSRPRTLLVATTCGTLLLTLGVSRLRYDHNLLNLQAEGLESVRLERKLVEESDRSIWFALSISDSQEELRRRKQRFERLASVDRVEDISDALGGDDPMFGAVMREMSLDASDDGGRKRSIIGRIHQRLADLPERPPEIPIRSPGELGRVLGAAQAVSTGSPTARQAAARLERVRDAMRRMPEAECCRRISDYQHRLAGDLLSRLHTLYSIADPRPPCIDDLPESLVNRFVGADGQRLLRIYPKGDIWDMAEMKEFVEDVRSVDQMATGNPLQTYEASKQMKRSYEQAALYALVAIVVVLYIDFRGVRHTLLAMLPLGLGALQLFGILGLLDIPLNPANMIVLPLILGIGVDDGVHVVHDFRRQRGPYRMSPSTASGVLITSLTTMVGFGSLMIASHRGLESLGRVLTIGVSCCLFSSLIMLPAALAWITRNRRNPSDEPPDRSHEERADGFESASRKTYRRDPAHVQGLHTFDPAEVRRIGSKEERQ